MNFKRANYVTFTGLKDTAQKKKISKIKTSSPKFRIN